MFQSLYSAPYQPTRQPQQTFQRELLFQDPRSHQKQTFQGLPTNQDQPTIQLKHPSSDEQTVSHGHPSPEEQTLRLRHRPLEQEAMPLSQDQHPVALQDLSHAHGIQTTPLCYPFQDQQALQSTQRVQPLGQTVQPTQTLQP
eukprot:scpid98591/ scgid14456/ 